MLHMKLGSGAQSSVDTVSHSRRHHHEDMPQVTTDPVPRIAANALLEAWNSYTSRCWSCTALRSSPKRARSNKSIAKHCQQIQQVKFGMLRIPQLLLDCTAVTTKAGTAPGADRSIAQDCSQCAT